MVPQWRQLLSQRGILTAAIEACWEPHEQGWSYPVYDAQGIPCLTKDRTPIRRWKAFDSASEFKYLWIPKGTKEQRPKYYLLPDTIRAIQSANGSVYLASGEPDVLAFRAAGAKNTLCWFGEKAIPSTLKEDLILFGVNTVDCFPDLDEIGTLWAQLIQKQLANSSIAMNVFRLPAALGEKGDINKLWMHLRFAPDAFWDTVVLCEKTELAPERATAPVKATASLKEYPQAFYDAIARALGVEKYKEDGWSTHVKCPMKNHSHDEQKPSAGWHREKHIFYCFKCGIEEMLAKDIAAVIGVDWREYVPRNVTVTTVPTSLHPATPVIPPITTWGAASVVVMDELNGKLHDSFHEPLSMWLKNIAKLGGLASKMLPGKVMAIQADSGHGKTSFIECWIDFQRRMGHDGVIWGPEWTNTEYIYRAIQRQGGPTFMQVVADKTWQSAQQRGIPEDKRYEQPLSEELRSRAVTELRKMNAWPGTLSFIDKMGLNVNEVIQAMTEVAIGYEANGGRLAFAVCDYAQLLQASGAKANERVDVALAAFKAFCVDRQLVGVVGSQVVKEAGKAAQGGKRMSQHDMQNTRGDYFNLVIAINREMDEATGELKPAATARVTKNSLGKNADALLFLNGERMTWHDGIVEQVHLQSLYTGIREDHDN